MVVVLFYYKENGPNMSLREQNGNFIYRFHLSMVIASPNLNLIPYVEVETLRGITPLSTNYVCRNKFTKVYPVMPLNCQTCTHLQINAYSKCHDVIVSKGVQDYNAG